MSDGEELLVRMSLEPSWSILEELEGHIGIFKEEEQRNSVCQTNQNTFPILPTLMMLYQLHHVPHVHGAEYEYSAGPNSNTLHHSVPCAVCYASARSSILMIPAKIQCPSTWTREYYGYLSSERANEPSQVPSGHYRSSFNCVDVNPEVIENSSGNRDGALFYYVLSDCDTNGLNCPPYEDGRILSCAVCTK